MSDIVVYNDGEIELSVSVQEENIWLSQLQMSELFETSSDNIGLHLKNIYKEGELDELATAEDFSVVRQEGNRKVKRNIKHYNLDAIISVGYRVSSHKATRFRQWATGVLRSYIANGFVINSEKITNERFLLLENSVNSLSSRLENVEKRVIDEKFQPKQGIFFDGQIYDAYAFVNNLIRSAKERVVLFDNYIDDTVLTVLSQNQKVLIRIYSRNIDKKLQLDIEKYNAQYKPIVLEKFELSHDRFLIIDDEIYHIGASLKDLGKKWFAFSKMSNESLTILGRV